MALYKIEWKQSAVRELRGLPRSAVERIIEAVEKLATNPYPTGARKMVNAKRTYRVREGDYRIIYTIASSLTIEIIRVGHRKDVYDR